MTTISEIVNRHDGRNGNCLQMGTVLMVVGVFVTIVLEMADEVLTVPHVKSYVVLIRVSGDVGI